VKQPIVIRKVLWIAAGVASAVALAAVLVRPSSWASRAGVSQPADANVEQGTAAYNAKKRVGALGELPSWQLGVTTTFQLDQASSVTSVEGAPIIAISLTGPLDVTAVSDSLLRFSFAGQLASLNAGDAVTGMSAQTRSDLEDELHQPFTVSLPLRATSDFRITRSVSPFVMQTWQSLIASLLLTANSDMAQRWTASESGPLGKCDFHYELTGNKISKTASSCRHEDGSAAQGVVYTSVALETQFGLGEAGRLDTLDTDQDLTTEANPVMPAVRSQNKLSLARRSQHAESPDTLLAWAQQANQEAVDAHEAATAMQQNEVDKSRLGGRKFANIMARLHDLQPDMEKPGDKRDKFEREYIALVAALRLEPTQHLDAIKQHIAKNGKLSTTLIAALEQSGTEVAHEVMADLVRDPKLELGTKVELARGLSLTPNPSPTSVAALRELKSDPVLAEQAVYGLGSSAYKTKASNPDLSADVTKELVDELDGTEDHGVQVTRLVALGNAGAESAIDSIQRQMSSPVPNVRVAAAQALRRIPLDKADELLAVLATDVSADVRASAIDALGERTPSQPSITTLTALCVQDPEVRVRAMAVQLAGRWLRAVPALTPVLLTVADDDASEGIRVVARNALSSASAG